MARPNRQQVDVLDAYWRALELDPATPPPPDLDAEAAWVLRGIAGLRPEAPDPTFITQLGQRLQWEANPAVMAARTQARRKEARRWWLPAGAGLAAALVLALGSALLWPGRTPQVSAAAVIERAQAVATAPVGFHNYALTEVSEVQPADTDGTVRVRSTTQRWYQAPGQWRREVETVVTGPDNQVLSKGGLVSVSDGSTLWVHRLRDNVVTIKPAGQARASEIGPFPEVTGGLSSLLAQAGACYSPKLTGTDTVAGRPVHVLSLGRSICALPGEQPVEWTIWIDKATFVILKSVQEIDGIPVATVTATRVEYDLPMSGERFRFDAPAGATVRQE